MNKTKKLTFTAIITAITTVSSGFIYIPVGFAKIFPIQHFANVLSAVLLGPWYALAQAFITSTLRNMQGTGGLFAYPGSMIGALLAAYILFEIKKDKPCSGRRGDRDRDFRCNSHLSNCGSTFR